MSQAEFKLQALLRSQFLLSLRIHSPLILIAGFQAPSCRRRSWARSGRDRVLLDYSMLDLFAHRGTPRSRIDGVYDPRSA